MAKHREDLTWVEVVAWIKGTDRICEWEGLAPADDKNEALPYDMNDVIATLGEWHRAFSWK